MVENIKTGDPGSSYRCLLGIRAKCTETHYETINWGHTLQQDCLLFVFENTLYHVVESN